MRPIEYRSAGGATVTRLQKELPMKGRLNMAKPRSGGAFLTDDQYQCLLMAIAGGLPMAPRELPIDT